MRFRDRYQQLIHANSSELQQARERQDALHDTVRHRPEFANERLGDSCRRSFIAAADPSVNAAAIPTADLARHVARLYQGADVIYRTKRRAIVRVGVLFCICNRFGVASYSLPFLLKRPFELTQEFAPDFGFSGSLPERIGATADGRDRGDTVYRYESAAQAAA